MRASNAVRRRLNREVNTCLSLEPVALVVVIQVYMIEYLPARSNPDWDT
jgi:hypothetical protein